MTARLSTTIVGREKSDQVPLVVRVFVIDGIRFQTVRRYSGALDAEFPGDTEESIDEGVALSTFGVSSTDRADDLSAVLANNAHLVERFRQRGTAQRVIQFADEAGTWLARWRAAPAETLLLRAEGACDHYTLLLRKALKRGQSPGRTGGRMRGWS